MANREQKSNREVRKPKKDTGTKKSAPATVQSTFAATSSKGGKKK